MAYQVLARKWRPRNFTQLVGQEHVSRSLCNALQHNRLHHAYLFTGTRGVGKTTVARILARAMNCENLDHGNPCGHCAICQAFDEGRFLDLIEVDAASRTKVEDTRELLDNVQYAPHQGRYKIYLIDEVHMLSGHSFNALLKTLEEPPEHVKFLLATTDPQKIPVTVLSRCLQFNLKRLSSAQISQQMRFILQQESIYFDDSALKLLSRAAEGSLRDGLSLLDQAISFGQGEVHPETVTAMLGMVAQHPVDKILCALGNNDAAGLFQTIAEIAEFTVDFSEVLQHILRVLHHVSLQQIIPDFVDDEFDLETIKTLAKQLPVEDVQLFYQIGLMGQKDLDLAPDPRSGFEMVMLRMLSFKPDSLEPTPESPSQKTVSQSVPVNSPKPDSAEPTQSSTTSHPNSANQDWSVIIAALNIRGRARELANNCTLKLLDDKVCHLELDAGFTQVGTKAEEKLQQALQNYCGYKVKLVIETTQNNLSTPAQQAIKAQQLQQQQAVDAIQSDQVVLKLKQEFDARVMPGTIEPYHNK